MSNLGNALAALLGSKRRLTQATDTEAIATRLGLGDRTGIRTPGQSNYLLGAGAQGWKLGINKTGSTIPANSLVGFDGLDATTGLMKLKALTSSDIACGVTLHAAANNKPCRYHDFQPSHVIRVPSGVAAGDRVRPHNSGSGWISSAKDSFGPLLVRAILGSAGSDQYALAAYLGEPGIPRAIQMAHVDPNLLGNYLKSVSSGTATWDDNGGSHYAVVDLGGGCPKVDDVYPCLAWDGTNYFIATVPARLKSAT